jgi:hypothetical protein
MRIKFVVSFIESTYSILGFIAVVGIFASFFFVEGVALAITIISLLAVLVIIFFLKVRMINFYLKRCLYPNEFLSVLEHLDLMEDLEINWSNDGARNSSLLTQQFLDDNKLSTEIVKKKISIPYAIFMCIMSFGLIIYFSQDNSIKHQPIVMLAPVGLLAMSIFLLIRGKKQQNDNEPVLIFDDKAFMLGEDKITWEKINFWKYKQGSRDSKGYVLISFQDTNNNLQELKADLDLLNIDRIDFLLLMSHFKTKYDSAVAATDI